MFNSRFLIAFVTSDEFEITNLAFLYAIKVFFLSLEEKIENLSEHIKKFKKDKHSSVGLIKAVNKRKKLLDYLKKNKMEAYKDVISKLNLRK